MTETLLANNRAWAARKNAEDPEFFSRLTRQQAPRYFWIGCSDSRVPANEIVGKEPGEVFVHRNVANLATPTDINFLSVLAFAVNVLRVQHVIVCGHYGCGGVRAAFTDARNGIIDHWLEPVRDTYRAHRCAVDGHVDQDARINALCELNVKAEVQKVACTTIMRDAWAKNQNVHLHGWIYGLSDGLIRDLGVSRTGDLAS